MTNSFASDVETLTVAVTGSSGMIGKRLVSALERQGCRVRRVVRRETDRSEREIHWDPSAKTIETDALEDLDGVIHLAGENVAEGRWTAAKKERIFRSRVEGTQLLCETLAKLHHPPRVVVTASAIGYYGSRGDELLNESSSSGGGFLAEVCRQWEAAARPLAGHPNIRLIQGRIGVVLSPEGGALKKMLLPFRLGLGGVIGGGNQWVSWIAIDDLIAALQHILVTESLRGPVNLTAPQPVTNRQLTKTLGRVLHRPTLFPLPAAIARFALGEMADEMLLASSRVRPHKLLESRFRFSYPDLEAALRHLCQR